METPNKTTATAKQAKQSADRKEKGKEPRLSNREEEKKKGVVHVHLCKHVVPEDSVLSIHAEFKKKVTIVPPQGKTGPEYTIAYDEIDLGDLKLKTTVMTYYYQQSSNGDNKISRSYRVEDIGEFKFLTIRFEDIKHEHKAADNGKGADGALSNHVSKSTVYYGGAE